MSRIDSVYLRNYRLFAPLLDEEFMNAFAEQLRVFVNDPEGDDDDNQDNQVSYHYCLQNVNKKKLKSTIICLCQSSKFSQTYRFCFWAAGESVVYCAFRTISILS